MPTIKTTCAYCGVGCGLLAQKEGSEIKISGDLSHPANAGKLCSKGLTLGDTLDLSSRLSHPEVDGKVVDWSEATQTIAQRLSSTIAEHGPDSVGFYVSGQLLTEDYYVANKLMKGYIGSANIDTNSRLCMASTVAGHKRAFGADIVPGDYEDLDQADLVVLVGSNLAWCHPILFQRLKKAQENNGTKIVVIDPRRTDSCDIADLFIPIMPGGDVLLFNGLLVHLNDQGAAPSPYCDQHVNGYEDALHHARQDAGKLEAALKDRGISDQVGTFYDLYTQTEKVVTIFSQGVNQGHNGSDRVNAIINCHLATGRIGKPGMGPFSVTGQPNAMGGREVGGLANMLAAHMGFSETDKDIVRDFWQSPRIAQNEGLRAVDMFDAVHGGRIKAIWIMATNPAVSMPNAHKVREALSKCPLVIVSDCVKDTDTQKYAHIRLPASGWSEKDGTVTNSERTISRQRALTTTFAQARPDWKIITDVAAAMGWKKAFSYQKPADIIREHAALSIFRNGDGHNMSRRAFDIGGQCNITDEAYENMTPFKWPYAHPEQACQKRLFAKGDFLTADRKANMIPLNHKDLPNKQDQNFPFLLNTGRYRDQWHTMTRTGLAAKLNGHRPEPLLDISPKDARQHDLSEGDFVEITSAHGRYLTRARITDQQKSGEVFLPMHWTDQQAGKAVIGSLMPPTLDPLSKQPAFKTVPVRIKKRTMTWRAVLLSRHQTIPQKTDYWTSSRQTHCHLTRLASQNEESLTDIITQLKNKNQKFLEYHDEQTGMTRMISFDQGQIDLMIFAGKSLSSLNLSWLMSQFSNEKLAPTEYPALMAGFSRNAPKDPGPTICSCFQVGLNDILDVISNNEIFSPEQLGEYCNAGTNCGSCVPELKRVITENNLRIIST